MSGSVALYSAVDNVVTHFEVDVEKGKLTRKSTLQLPAKVQYAWPHPNGSHLYVSTSNGGPRAPGDRNHVSALAIGPKGALSIDGESLPLPRRAVHMCVDPTASYVINAHNFQGGGVTIHRLLANGRLGDLVPQPLRLNLGIYPHQVMVSPSGERVILVDRGNNATKENGECPGALRSFTWHEGVLSESQAVAPNGGFGFGPRHISFHPKRPWVYVSDERTNRLYMFRMHDNVLETTPAFSLDSLACPELCRPRQIAGPIHVHPKGHVVYIANRADQTIEVNGQKVFGGGENNIAVYSIDQQTGEPKPLQHADTHSIHVRTFAIDPSGRLLVTASIKGHSVIEDGLTKPVPAALSLFRIDSNGLLRFLQRVDIETPGDSMQYWMGMMAVL